MLNVLSKLFQMALKIIDYNSVNYQKMVELRYQILRKPLGLSFDKAELEKEINDIHLGCFDDDKLEGCCILTPEGATAVRLRQMAVSEGLQGKGIGRVLMLFAENVARDLGKTKLTMHARKSAIGFYEKLGYNIVGGEFVEVSIPHYVMQKDLTLIL